MVLHRRALASTSPALPIEPFVCKKMREQCKKSKKNDIWDPSSKLSDVCIVVQGMSRDCEMHRRHEKSFRIRKRRKFWKTQPSSQSEKEYVLIWNRLKKLFPNPSTVKRKVPHYLCTPKKNVGQGNTVQCRTVSYQRSVKDNYVKYQIIALFEQLGYLHSSKILFSSTLPSWPRKLSSNRSALLTMKNGVFINGFLGAF